MKAFLAIVGGFVFTLAIFASGAAVAMWFLTAKPVQQAQLGDDVAYLWSKEPRTVTAPTPGLERLPSRPVEADVNFIPEDQAYVESDVELVDATTTGSVKSVELSEQVSAEPDLRAAHLEWCSSRYRSFRQSDNSYTPYSGGRRTCSSPFLQAVEGSEEASSNAEDLGEADLLANVDDRPSVSADHVDYCYSRYQSYRPEDNSYQPYGGGPRRQCE